MAGRPSIAARCSRSCTRRPGSPSPSRPLGPREELARPESRARKAAAEAETARFGERRRQSEARISRAEGTDAAREQRPIPSAEGAGSDEEGGKGGAVKG